MQRTTWLLLSWLAPAAAWGETPPLIPEARPANFYEKLWQSSPFALATVAPVQAEPTISFAADWVLTGLASLPDGNGGSQPWVGIASRDRRINFSLQGQEVKKHEDPSIAGVELVHVELAESDAGIYAELKKGSETARVKFSEETSAAASSNGASSGGGGNPGVRPNRAGVPMGQSAPAAAAAGPRYVAPADFVVPEPGRRTVLGGMGKTVVPAGPPPNRAQQLPGATTVPTVRTRNINNGQ